MRVWDAAGAADSPQTLHFSAAEFALPQLGFIVENKLLQHCLLERLRALDVDLRFDTPIETIEFAGGTCTLGLQDGSTLAGQLLIGADGAASRVREEAGIETDGWRYPQVAVVTHAVPQKAHQFTAWQRFLNDGPLALLPLVDGRVSIVWTTTAGHAATLLAASEKDFCAQLGAASDYVLGEMSGTGPRASFPLRAQHAQHYVREGVALIGDAAHTVHPLAGQGANLGLADASRLAAVIGAALDDDECPADLPVLRRYERAQRGPNQSMLYFVDGLNRLFAAKSPLLTRVRGEGMRLFNHSGPLRRRAVKVALGLDASG
jgi:2-octaprenylphenol hydroxylase